MTKSAQNALGQRQLRKAIFVHAWPDPGILARDTKGTPKGHHAAHVSPMIFLSFSLSS